MPKKILVIGSERPIARLMQVNLERAGYAIIIALDIQEALEAIRRELFDLIILDRLTADVDSLLNELKKHLSTQAIPIILLSPKAKDTPGKFVYKQGSENGIIAHLSKPFNPMELIACVRRTFREKSEQSGYQGWVDVF